MQFNRTVALAGLLSLGMAVVPLVAAQAVPEQDGEEHVTALADAQRLFYTGRYEDAAAVSADFRTSSTDGMAAYDLHSSALLFQLKRVFGDPKDKEKALKQCVPCASLIAAFGSDIDAGREMARARLAADSTDVNARFFLGKLNLNHVWLQLGTLGRRTGWNEYWEARHSLDSVLKQQPGHVRGRIARAWIDYIVDTRMPFGTGWLFGGGDKKRALRTVREAANSNVNFFDRTEATFALWDMNVREKNFKDAVLAARDIARDFPENAEIARFLKTHDPEADAFVR
jgi:hypothetical protein